MEMMVKFNEAGVELEIYVKVLVLLRISLNTHFAESYFFNCSILQNGLNIVEL